MVVHESRPSNAESGLAALTEVPTPTDAFYVRGHGKVPEVDPAVTDPAAAPPRTNPHDEDTP
ncbi:hypothetical protein GOOTI_271_00030 [Gordonia otitidis NBRC 100426]|uniref:Uncharacterized protein n=1 Tax=Gordonia otitidis (strain DSM 44809 / CCUG 52243 / JCM 12355 / NBRC 100426 / IFM 10032) TaxID=1108044 RepID=H5TUJ7_GORO1|nr:hypothetical protein GOOTI_271_00030 [Gordonia otitidis NBRC 100426]